MSKVRENCQKDYSFSFTVLYNKNRIIGEFKIDLFVEDSVIIEIKSVNKIIPAHEMQLVNYLSITGINDGLVINFGNLEKLEVRRKFRIYKQNK